jgi:hypothetical protein
MANPRVKKQTDTSADVFVYTGAGCSVPKDVVRVKFDPSALKVAAEAFFNCKNLREVVINDGLQKIGMYAFCNCTSLQGITLPSSITEIGNYAFNSCVNLREVVLNDGLQKIGWNAFENCDLLHSIALPSSITEICDEAFFDCHNLREVVLNDGLQKIGNEAFWYCESLQSISVPFTVAEIGNYAFLGCRSLQEIILHEGLGKIGDRAFEDCRSVEVFRFPSSRLSAIAGKWADLNNKLNEIRSVVQWEGGELFVPTAAMEDGNNWDSIKTILCRIKGLVSYYEMKEATTIIELALWKSKLDQAGRNATNRNEHRIEVPGPVKDNILEYLSEEFNN